MATSLSSMLQSIFETCTAPSVNKSICCDKSQQEHSTIALESHKSDPPMQCIIDSNEVKRLIIFQGEELIRQERIERIENSKNQNQCGASSRGSSSMLGAMDSFVANTNLTTASSTETGATPLRNNLNDYSSTEKNKYRSKLEQVKVLEAIGAKCTFQNKTCRETNINEKKLLTKKIAISPKSARLKKGIALNEEVPLCSKLGDGRFCDTVNPCLYLDNETLRKDYGRALHLKMKAHMGKFFWLKYLEKFPQSPIPKSIALSRSVSIESISRSRTNSNSLVNYGNSIHSEAIKMMINDSDFLDLGMTGSLGLVKRFEVAETGQRLKSPNHYKALLNRRSGVPIAICTLKSPYGSPVVRIFTVKQRFYSQKPASTTKRLGINWCQSYPLYAWAELSADGEFPNPVEYSMYISNDSDGQLETKPSYRAFHRTIGSPELLVMGKTGCGSELTGAAIISLQFNDEEDYLSVSVARGIDPALILCFAGIIDETMENSMRTECERASKPFSQQPNKSVLIEI